jgi:TonB-dependent receptor-like protein
MLRGRYWGIVAILLLLALKRVAAQETRDTTPGTPADTTRPAPLTSQATLTGDFLSRLPIDDPRHALMLVPGVVLRGGDIGIASAPQLSIRGSPLGEASVYVDGAPVRSELLGTQGLSLGTLGIDAVAVTTGVPDVTVGDARGGVISYITPAGGAKLTGRGRADSDEPFWDGSTVGYNRFEGEVGGRLAGVPHLTWFVSGTLQGQRSQYYGRGAADQPAYVVGGVDTLVHVTDASGTTTVVPVPRFVQWSGSCGAASNSGYDCQGLRRPMDWSTLRRGQTRLSYAYGSGSSVSLTGILLDLQQRAFPGADIADPALYRGTGTTSRLGVVNWSQALGAVGGGPLTLSANLSLASDERIDAPLTPASELATRDPGLGIEWQTLQFTGADIVPFPVTDAVLRTVRTNSGLPVPFPNRTDLNLFQAGRFNPYGLQFGWPTNGLRTTMARAWEQRLDGRARLEWRPGTHHVVTVGGELGRTDLSVYDAELVSLIGFDAFRAAPHRNGWFASDRMQFGRLVVDVGARWDHYNANGLFPRVPGFILGNPRAALYPNAATDPAQYAAFLADTGIWSPSRSHHALSPRLRAAYALSSSTSLRAGYGQQAELPSFADELGNTNSDLAFTDVVAPFGRDVEYAKPVLMELGARHELAPDLSLDLSLYHKTHIAPFAFRLLPFVSPRQASETLSISVLTKVDGAHGTGIDASVAWRRGNVLSGSLAYSLLRAQAFDQAAHVTTHALYAVAELNVPSGWQAGTTAGEIARDLSALLTLRLATGLPYTMLSNNGTGSVAPFAQPTLAAPAVEYWDASQLPTTKTLDLRLTKGLRAGGHDVTLYADVRNLFNFTNVVALYAETGAVVNDRFRQNVLGPEQVSLQAEASAAGALNADGSIALSISCNAWGTPANCVALRRVEARFGNGDLLYTPAEQTRVLDTYYNSFFGPWRFNGPARTVRVGVELAF